MKEYQCLGMAHRTRHVLSSSQFTFFYGLSRSYIKKDRLALTVNAQVGITSNEKIPRSDPGRKSGENPHICASFTFSCPSITFCHMFDRLRMISVRLIDLKVTIITIYAQHEAKPRGQKRPEWIHRKQADPVIQILAFEKRGARPNSSIDTCLEL
jgi:hypothetical protein